MYAYRYFIIHTYIHTHIPTYLHTFVRTYVRTYIHTYTHAHMHSYTDIYIYMHTHIQVCDSIVIRVFLQSQPSLGDLGAWCLFEVLQTRLKAHVGGSETNG